MSVTSLFHSQGLQNFFDETLAPVLVAINGAPGAGQFRSSITGRAPITDITQDLKPRMGVERIMFEQPVEILNEFGPSGERVFSVLNDDRGLIRLVGQFCSNIGATGTVTRGNATTDFAEVTFYGTGLNLLIDHPNYLFPSAYFVDGGSSVAITSPAGSTVIRARNVAVNQVLPIVSGLSLGLHTVKISISTSDIFGVEILNESSSLKTNMGSDFVQGKKLYVAAQDVSAYNSGFTNTYGSAGVRGGHVLVYSAPDGTIKKDIQYTDTTQLNLASADHTNEEIVRSYNFREFGAGVNNDFSSGNANIGFTLDDGTTTLIGSGVAVQAASPQLAPEFVRANGNGTYLQIVFVGTGLDIIRQDDANGGSDTYTVTVDGSSVGTVSSTGSTIPRVQKLVSGLPYGTHVVRYTRTTAATFNSGFSRLNVYQPKKPALPTGAIELADYNLMADLVKTTDDGHAAVSTGTLFKSAMREMIYVGTWTNTATQAYLGGNFIMNSGAAAGDFMQYTFFGTGFELMATNAGTGTYTVTIDGSLYTGAATTTGGQTWTPGTGTFGVPGAGYLQVTGLTLGTHTVKFTKTSTGGNYAGFQGISIITPIHSAKSNLYGDLQNALPVGSNAISDNRKITPVKDALPAVKAWAQAVGITSSPTTTSTSFVPVPDLSVTIKTSGGALDIRFFADIINSGLNTTFLVAFVDGIQSTNGKGCQMSTANFRMEVSDSIIVPVAAGTHKVDVYWQVGTGTATSNGAERNLTVREI